MSWEFLPPCCTKALGFRSASMTASLVESSHSLLSRRISTNFACLGDLVAFQSPRGPNKRCLEKSWEMPTQIHTISHNHHNQRWEMDRNGVSSIGSTAAKWTVWLQWPEKSSGEQCLQPASEIGQQDTDRSSKAGDNGSFLKKIGNLTLLDPCKAGWSPGPVETCKGQGILDEQWITRLKESTLPWHVHRGSEPTWAIHPNKKTCLAKNNVNMYSRAQLDNVCICMDLEYRETYLSWFAMVYHWLPCVFSETRLWASMGCIYI